MEKRIEQLLSRFSEVEALLGDPSIYNNKERYRELTQEHSYLNALRTEWLNLKDLEKQQKENRKLLKETEDDPEFTAMLEEELERIEETIPRSRAKIETLLVPPDPLDHRNTIVELRAGTGGTEAALFVADVARMYKMYCDRQGWKYEILAAAPAEIGGLKELIMLITGKNAYRFMKFEGGTHRVQRVPETETQGRVHTSAMTVAILLEPEEREEIDIDEKDIRIDTYRASGAGGQHVNTTDSAVRITHLPTGIVAYCQEERSQHKNKEKALRYLKAKISEVEEEKKAKEEASTRSKQVGTGDRSERIRTYNYSQNRVTDHRINLTKYNLDRVLEGELEEFSEALVADAYAKKMQGVAAA